MQRYKIMRMEEKALRYYLLIHPARDRTNPLLTKTNSPENRSLDSLYHGIKIVVKTQELTKSMIWHRTATQICRRTSNL